MCAFAPRATDPCVALAHYGTKGLKDSRLKGRAVSQERKPNNAQSHRSGENSDRIVPLHLNNKKNTKGAWEVAREKKKWRNG